MIPSSVKITLLERKAFKGDGFDITFIAQDNTSEAGLTKENCTNNITLFSSKAKYKEGVAME